MDMDNGMKVLLISDPEMMTKDDDDDDQVGEDEGEETSDDDGDDGDDDDDDDEEVDMDEEEPSEGEKKAAAAMVCWNGSFADPEQAQGLSHFLEHMLFMGSEKFPDENEYDAFITIHGGFSNAFTEAEYTCYHFDVQPKHLYAGLDRFAQFFIQPLMKEDSTEREVQAVDSEFFQALQSDACRLAQVRSHTAKEGHIYTKFMWGNKKSLVDDPEQNGVNVRSLLLDHYNRTYSAQRMCLCILGGEDLQTMERWVKELFGNVKPASEPLPDYSGCGFPYEGGMLYKVPGVKEGHGLHMLFQLPSLEDHYSSKPDEYLSHLIGHEGKGSVLALLKEKGWASDLSAGVAEEGCSKNSLAYMFSIDIMLTEQGLFHHMEIVGLIFQYLAMLRSHDPQEWVFREIQSMSDLKFMYFEEEDPADYTVRLAAGLNKYAAEHCVSGEYLHMEWRPDLVTQLLHKFLTPENCRIDIVSHSFGESTEDKGDMPLEPWFNVPFTFEIIDPKVLVDWKQPSFVDASFALPGPNVFIPRSFDLICDKHGHAESLDLDASWDSVPLSPSVIHESAGLRVWHKLDARHRTPRATFFLAIDTLLDKEDPHLAVVMMLFTRLVEDKLQEVMYMADLAGLQSTFRSEGTRMELRAEGFSDRMPILVSTMVHEIVSHCPTESRFLLIKEILLRDLKNALMKPRKHATHLRRNLLVEKTTALEDLIKSLEEARFGDVYLVATKLLQDNHIEMLIQGNINQSSALKLALDVREMFTGSRILAAERQADRVLQLKEKRVIRHRVSVVNPDEKNSAVENYYMVGPETLETRVLVDLIDQMTIEPAYNQLRTLEQLGYTVGSGTRLTHGVLGFVVFVQSNQYHPQHLDERIEAFLVQFGDMLATMDQEEFQRHVEALVSLKTQKDKCLYDEAIRWWDHIWNRNYELTWREKQIERLKVTTLPEVQNFYKQVLHHSSKARKKLTVQVHGCDHAIVYDDPNKTMHDVECIRSFKRAQPMWHPVYHG